ncbi:formylglycine-generating enzyme family protein [Alterisphingorhabdus coralli]|uniref:Formylglycine-generating enzyme family protein n=1 Tax=Alterisphingorhabdus coralli TaxID=3071408 RepID=A0AA97F6X3_9SPHN|nr:formylglycine-generating enzyme family protein [Parasphingorhabdus sp. SCSIO 66989]WOE75524.1 formylglycine-generating enzyme family protein [Parasphingorhabdus sp. SCSIO 66989]
MAARRFALTVMAVGIAAACSPAPEENSEPQWVALSGGCFQMGESRIYPEEGPVREACVAPFEMMRHEVTNAQFAAFVDATGYKTRAERGWSADEADGPGVDLPPSSAVFAPSAEQRQENLSWWRLVEGAYWQRPFGPDRDDEPDPQAPVVHITREDAQAYAKWAGGRLPSEAEWEYAARGGLDGKLMAWEDAEAAAVTQKANTWQGAFPAYDAASDGFAGVAPVGSFPANGFGLYDMIGNVWEWTATPYAPDHSDDARARAGVNGLDPAQPGASVGTIRGGSFLCAKSYCYRYRPAARQAQDLSFGTSHIGFRLVRD